MSTPEDQTVRKAIVSRVLSGQATDAKKEDTDDC
jgi:hypothetical protein